MKKIYLSLATALIFTINYSQSATCAGATELTNDGEFSFTSGDTTGKGSEGGNTSPDAFYFITPGAFQTVNVGLCGTDPNFDTKLIIYSDCTLTTIIAENDDSDCGLQSKLSFQSDDTSTYIVMVEGSDTPFPGTNDLGAFEISVWFEAPIISPPAAQGLDCNPSLSDAGTIVFSEELDDNSGGWTGDIVYSGNSNGSWEIISTGGATSTDTGPSGPFSGTTYMNFEASGSGTASAVSSAIDLSGANIVEQAELSFYMHAYGIEMGILEVGVGTSAAGPFNTELTWTGQYQTIETDPWFQVGVDLTSYIGQTVYIEFKHTDTNSGFHGDMSIDLVEVTVCDSTVLTIIEESAFENFTLYPNPTASILNFKAQDTIETISIYNLLGQEVKRVRPRQLQTHIDIENLSIGVYVVKVQIGNQVGSYKIVKQ